MKKIILILLILFVPVGIYMFLSEKNSSDKAVAFDNNNPSLLAFTSTMCTDCKRMKDVLNKVKPEYKEKVNFRSINALDNDKQVQAYIKEYDITLVPTLVFLDRNGKKVNKTEGYISEEELKQHIERLTNE